MFSQKDWLIPIHDLFFLLIKSKVKCKSRSGLCKVQSCRKRGQFFKRLDKHLSRAHPDITEKEHTVLPKVKVTQPSYMRYRVKEKCGLCGKTLLLQPHLKSAHKIETWEEYTTALKKQNKRILRSKVQEKEEIPNHGLHSLLVQISTVSGKSKKRDSDDLAGNSVKRALFREDEHIETRKNREISPNCGQGLAQTLPYSEEEFLRFCVHNTNLYSVLATHHAMKEGKKDPAMVLHILSKKKMSIEYCRNLIDMDLLQKLHGYYRFSEFYPYAKEKCISGCASRPCSCGLLPRSFYSFCKRACNPLLNCTVCKNWGSGYHTCPDFFECEVCTDAAQRCPLKL